MSEQNHSYSVIIVGDSLEIYRPFLVIEGSRACGSIVPSTELHKIRSRGVRRMEENLVDGVQAPRSRRCRFGSVQFGSIVHLFVFISTKYDEIFQIRARGLCQS
jgi:hypothetical protein